MGWKGTMRSLAATARRMEKEAERKHKQQLKERIAADASDAVSDWERYIDNLLSVHTNLTRRIDWHRMIDKPAPKQPQTKSRHSDRAMAAMVGFKPGMFDFLTGGTKKKKSILEQNLKAATEKDRIENERILRKYDEDVAEWENDRSLAKRLVDGDILAMREVISELKSLSENDLIGSSVEFSIYENSVLARPQVHSDEVVPSMRRKQLASGKLSETKMPVGQFNELYQDYVASVALKVAGDLFQVLPIDEVYVTCEGEMLNTATGHKAPTPILSVQFVRKTFETLNLSNIDPSDSMINFNHKMNFSKTKGFTSITPLMEPFEE
ncbi:hypothetical protein [uncultured Roseobacter sp.]|uniref:hypothetical protein n=1 Tax=uncultured Roseobacter sp. TaxID=114847 RepID=UPI0026189292|nr:hypothetical protein [uncultured Roseobacter sp.]